MSANINEKDAITKHMTKIYKKNNMIHKNNMI